MNRLSRESQKQLIAALVEGNSIRATVRMTGASNNAIQRLLAAQGARVDPQKHPSSARNFDVAAVRS